jgi:hypothetical protein
MYRHVADSANTFLQKRSKNLANRERFQIFYFICRFSLKVGGGSWD